MNVNELKSNKVHELAEKYKSDMYPIKLDLLQKPSSQHAYENPLDVNDILQYGYLYLMKNENTGLYKIGCTFNPKARLKGIRAQSSCDIKYIFIVAFENYFDESNYIAEKYLHIYFKDKRKTGEWFNLDAYDLLAFKNWAWEVTDYVLYKDEIYRHFNISIN